jgi:hypothetical protein
MSASAFLAALIVSATFAMGSERPFTFVYDTYALGKGGVEYEQWATWETHKDEEHGFDRFRFRHEFEFGLADNFTLAVYAADWNYEDSHEKKGTQYEGSGIEAILYLTNPVKDFVGIGLYNEVIVGEESFEYEFKVLLHKDIGNWTLAYNFVLETEVEGIFHNNRENEIEGVLGHAFGVSYNLSPRISVGGEAVLESIYKDWSNFDKFTAYAGPKISYFSENHWWVTVTGLVQMSSEADEPDFVVRAIFGWQF